MRTAVIATHDSAAARARLALARQAEQEALLVAPPEVQAALGARAAPAIWASAAELAELGGTTPALARSVAAALALRVAHRERPLTAIRYGAVDAGGWAAALTSRQGAELDGARLIAELEPEAAGLVAPLRLGEGLEIALERAAALAALRDADAVEGDEAARAALTAAGCVLCEPRASPAARARTISAVVTHYNLERYLPACLASLRAQTVPVEIVLVDDGSGPAGLRVVEEEAARDPAMKIVRQKNGGLAAARHAGIAAASGELLLIVDADNVMRPRLAQVLADALRLRPRASAAVPGFRCFEDGTDRTVATFCPNELHAATLLCANTAGDACSLHRREALLEAGGYLDSPQELSDWNLWLRYLDQGKTTAAVPEILFDYRVRPDSMLHSRSELQALHAQLALAANNPRVAAGAGPALPLMAARRLADLLEQARVQARVQARAELQPGYHAALAQAADNEARRRAADVELQSLSVELRAALSALDGTRAARATAEAARDRSQSALAQKLAELESARAELAAERDALHATREALAAVRVELSVRDAEGAVRMQELEALRAALSELRASSAVRAAELLRNASPALHRAVGLALRQLLRTARRS